MQTFFKNGIPPLGQRSGSKSKGSVSKEKHDDARLVEHGFEYLPDDTVLLQDDNVQWLLYRRSGYDNDWGSESDIHGLVKQVLQSAIFAVGLEGKIKCFNELSIFDLRPDIWIVVRGGAPIGVVEVKKPDQSEETLRNPYVQGQIFDYMLRLQSFFGLKNVFGILTSYEKWRVCWMPQSNRAASATSMEAYNQASEYDSAETRDIVPERVLYGSRFYSWNDPNLARMLATTIFKMYHSPRSEFLLIDSTRAYIKLDKDQWYWGPIGFSGDESDLRHYQLPQGNRFTLLADLREGADGRVWRACTDSGLGCCIKFPIRNNLCSEDTEEAQVAQIENELANWHKAYGKDSARTTTLSGRPALVMRYLRPLDLRDGEMTEETQAAVKTAIEKFAAKGLKHDDLATRHLGWLSPAKSRQKRGSESGQEIEPDVVLFDLGRVSEETDAAIAVAEMMSQLNI